MVGFLEGLSDTDYIKFCPICGEEVGEYYADGTAYCQECGNRFGVIITE